MKYILTTDIGSTFTKTVLWGIRENVLEKLQQVYIPTTVEKPYDDISIGVLDSIKKMEELNNLVLLKNDRIIYPFYISCSAGGGLRILVCGILKDISVKTARKVALGCGGIIVETISLDDGRDEIEKIRILKNIKPDIVLIVGGFEEGGVENICKIFYLLKKGNIKSKFKNIPPLFIYAGTSKAKEIFKEIFKDKKFYIVPNIRPDLVEENLLSCQKKIMESFIEHVMKNAPGFDKVKNLIEGEVLPTPLSIQKFLERFSINKNILCIDMGGATTDIYSCDKGKVLRTVSGDIGLSFNILNILKLYGLKKEDIKEYAIKKFLNPAIIPEKKEEIDIELYLAKIGINKALERHYLIIKNIETGFRYKTVREMFLKFKSPENVGPYLRYSKNIFEEKKDSVILSGGIFSKAPAQYISSFSMELMKILNVEKIYIDRDFTLPHLGLLLEKVEFKKIENFFNKNIWGIK